MNKRISSSAALVGAALCLAAAARLYSPTLSVKAQTPTPIGAWFGIARPCPADPVNDSPLHADFCRTVCGQCPSIPGALPPEVPMMPTLLADGTVLADDAGEIGRYHTTAHGKWRANNDDRTVVQLDGKQRFEATFFWLQSTPAPAAPGSLEEVIGRLGATCCFSSSVRPRFVTFFDPSDPDRMIGFIQPYLFPFVDPKTGLVKVTKPDPLDQLAGNHVPDKAVDPVGYPLPDCTPANGCLGTYHFVIRRIKAQ